MKGIEADGLTIEECPDIERVSQVPDDVMTVSLSAPVLTQDGEAFVVSFASNKGSGGPSILHLVPDESEWKVVGEMILAFQ